MRDLGTFANCSNVFRMLAFQRILHKFNALIVRIIHWTLLLFFFLGLLGSLKLVYVNFKLRQTRVLLEDIQTNGRASEPQLTALAEEILRDKTELPAVFYIELSQELSKAAGKIETDAARINLLCLSLGLLGRSLEQTPFDGSDLMAWANLRQALGQISCTEAHTSGSFKKVLELVTKRSPNNPDVLFSSGLLFMWSGNRARALQLWRQFLETDAEISSFHQSYILGAVQEPDDVGAVLPARFPQILRWTSIFQEQLPARFQELKGAFALLQLQALDWLKTAFENQQLQPSVYLNNLVRLEEFASSDEVRKSTDALLGSYLNRKTTDSAGTYLEERSKLRELDLIRTFVASERNPTKGPLSNWGRTDLVNFDRTGVTLGFFKSSGQSLKHIQLSGSEGDLPIEPAALQIFVSNDNQSWAELPLEGRITNYSLLRRPITVIDASNSDFQYWKIHFGSSGHSAYKNYLPKLLTAFGEGRRRAPNSQNPAISDKEQNAITND